MQIKTDIFYRFYSSYIKNYLGTLIAALVCMVMAALTQVVIVNFVKPIIDDIFRENTAISTLVSTSAAFLVVFILKGLFRYGENFMLDKLSLNVLTDLQLAVYSNIIYLDLEFYKTTTSGDIISRLTNDLKNVQFALNEIMINLGRNLVTVVALALYLFIRNFWLALICFVVFVLLGVMITKISKKIRELSKHVQSEAGRWTSFLTETFSCIRLIKSSSSEKFQISKASDILNTIYRFYFKSIQTETIMHPIMEMLCGVAVFLCMILGGLAIIKSYMTVGDLFQFLAAFLMAYKPAKSLAELTAQVQIGHVSVSRVFELIDRKSKVKDKEKTVAIPRLNGSIDFSNVSFKYEDAEESILDKVNLSIPENSTTVIVGESGIGKSTLINLLLRYYDVNDGEIKIDGVNIADMKLKDLHENISVVSQDIELFNDTIRNNIRYGIRDIDDEQIFNAASAANIDDFIVSLPDGYETIVGEGGVNFSGGQKQRIAIARAFLKDAPILIFDEPTSALDGANTAFINNSIKKFSHKKTILIITHSKEHFDNVDKIIEFRKNEIVSKIFN